MDLVMPVRETSVHGCILQILDQCASEQNIDQLQAAADSENRPAKTQKVFQEGKLQSVYPFFNRDASVVLLSIGFRIDISASRKKEPVEGLRPDIGIIYVFPLKRVGEMERLYGNNERIHPCRVHGIGIVAYILLDLRDQDFGSLHVVSPVRIFFRERTGLRCF
jgi:hypothetical protein